MNTYTWRSVLVLVLLVLAAGLAHGQPQVEVIGSTLTVGPKPTTPVGSTVRLDGLASTGGTSVVFTTPAGDLVRRALIRTDMPAGIAFLDTANIFTQLNTFNAGITASTASVTGALTVGSTASVTGALTVGGTAAIGGTTTINGNLVLTGAGRRIQAQMDGPEANRLSFQTSTVNGPTFVQSMPNGTGTQSTFTVLNRSDPGNAAYLLLYANDVDMQLASNVSGTGVLLPLVLTVGGQERIRLETNEARSVLTSNGLDAAWQYNGRSNISGQRHWRAGNIGGQFRVDAGNDAATVWSDLFRGTQANGVPDGVYWGNGVRQVTPNKPYQTQLGTITNKYLALHAAELWVETLVQHNTMATIGGRILVGPTTTLVSPHFATAGRIYTKHNNLAPNDTIYLEANGQVEFMQILNFVQACPCPPAADAPDGVATGYLYSLSVGNMDGSGFDNWSAGDAVFNTGQSGNGFIDIYSTRGVKSGSEIGPTIVGNIRQSGTYNDWAPRWAIGNLAGVYGNGASQLYGLAFGNYSEVWMQADSAYGLRGMDGLNQYLIVHPSGYIRAGNPNGRNLYIDSGANIIFYDTTTQRLRMDPTSIRFYDTGGTNVYTEFGVTGATFGYAIPNFGNTHITNAGQLYLRSGTSIRMVLDANNGAMTWMTPAGADAMQIRADAAQFGNVDQGARIQLASGVVQIFGGDGVLIQQNSGGNIHMGNWWDGSGDKFFMQITPTTLDMCRAGVGCPVHFEGPTGNLTLGGNVMLSGGGNVQSSGNFYLGSAEGLRFETWSGTSISAARSTTFYTGATFRGGFGVDLNGAMRIDSRARGAATGIRMMLGGYSTGGTEPGLAITSEDIGGDQGTQNVVQAAASYAGVWTRSIVTPYHAGMGGGYHSFLGRSDSAVNWWTYVYGGVYYSNNGGGYSGVVFLKNASGVNYCQMNFSGGIMTGHNC